ncbi:NAD(P)-binding domain-containing protein [Corynebacterium hindlerae]|uniref:NAD(P)-binding domain-containing protein n=1 Tax=Corynebacterium hindlerae TaxID=699041 RepID=UPI003AB09A18
MQYKLHPNDDLDHRRVIVGIATTWLNAWQKLLDGSAQPQEVFAEDSFWRDFVTFTWNIHTAEGIPQIEELIAHNPPMRPVDRIQVTEEVAETEDVTRVSFDFETPLFLGKGIVRIRDGKAWTLLTSARELKERREKRGRNRELGAQHGVKTDRRNWADLKAERVAALGTTEQPYVLIIGGGQGGIALAARLKRLRVPALVVDKHARPGDQWRGRYHSLCLHDPVWYDHLPYLPFPDDWPVFTPKDKMGDWLEHYVGIMDLDYWSNATCTKAEQVDGGWKVQVDRDGDVVELRPTQLVFATGMSGVPNMPTFPGQEQFSRDIVHSSQHPGGEKYQGKTVVVLGANNSAHDICADLYENGAHPVMVQRSSTHVSRSETLMKHVFGPLYSEDAVEAGIDTDTADMLFASWPYKLLPEVQREVFNTIREEDADYYQRLQDAGFMLDFGDDDSGLFLKYLRRGSGYYIDVGACELVANGSIELHSHCSIDHFTRDGVVLTDGAAIECAAVIFATGFGSMSGWVEKIVDRETAQKVGRCWGLGSDTTKDPGPWEGELRNMWKPTTVDNLWFHGGNLHQSRHYSRYLAIQLAARYLGMDTPVHKIPEVNYVG